MNDVYTLYGAELSYFAGKCAPFCNGSRFLSSK